MTILDLLNLPAIITWNRLEPRPRSTNFSRSLKAEIHDPLWMLTRQWQMGELKGEDSGSPVFARMKIETTQLTRYAEKNEKSVAHNENIPLETTVEKESIPIDLYTKIQMGHYWFRLLDLKPLNNNYRSLFRILYPIEVHSEITLNNANDFSNRKAWQLRLAAFKRGMDGNTFYLDLKNGKKAEDMTANALSIDASDQSEVAQASSEFISWFERCYTQKPPETDVETKTKTTWSPEHLEYQFECSVPESNGKQTVMVANEYYSGKLDWYSFDIDPTRDQLNDKDGQIINDDIIKDETLTFLPNPISIIGMPKERWWEIEDWRTGFVGIDVNTTDIAKLLLLEFGLACSNDWHYIPYRVPIGSLCEVKGLEVTDCFGQRTLIKPAQDCENEDWRKWNMFNLTHQNSPTTSDHRLFLPPTIQKVMEGQPIESINFIRDEMANMVWGIESTIPDNLGGGMNGYENATEFTNFIKQFATPSEYVPTGNEAKIRYQVANTPPENWIPFIRVHVPGSNRETQLQRASMLRTIKGLPSTSIIPLGDILRPDHRPDLWYYIHEEEIPRSGAKVTRSFQRTRWFDGTTFLWLGRRKQVGRGEGSSGLKFDQIEDIE